MKCLFYLLLSTVDLSIFRSCVSDEEKQTSNGLSEKHHTRTQRMASKGYSSLQQHDDNTHAESIDLDSLGSLDDEPTDTIGPSETAEQNDFDTEFDVDSFQADSLDKSSLRMAFMNMANAILGAGAIGTPFAMRNCGILGGIIALTVLTALVDFTIRLVIINMKLTGKSSYQDSVQHVLGKTGKIIIILAQSLFTFGGCIGFCIIIGDTIPHILKSFFPSYKTHHILSVVFSRNFIIVFVTLTISLPLSMLKNISKLAKTSAFALVSMALIIIIVLVRGPAMPSSLKGQLTLKNAIVTPRIFQGISVISFALVCHHNTSFIFHSIKDPSLHRFAKVTHASCLVAFIAIALIGFGGFAIFKDRTKGNVLNNFPSDDPVVNIARFCFGLNMLTTFPMEIFVLRDCFRDIIFINSSSTKDLTNLQHRLFTIILVLIIMSISLNTCNLGALLEIIGATTASVMAYILPPWCNLKLTWNTKTKLQKIPYISCIIFGFAIMFVSSTQTIVKAIKGSNEEHCVQ